MTSVKKSSKTEEPDVTGSKDAVCSRMLTYADVCRFQLTLKEGLTVFREQEFTAAMTSRAVKRIEDVRELRQAC